MNPRTARFLPVLLALTACATAGAVRSQPLDAGEAKFYADSLPTVVEATRQAVLSAGLGMKTTSQPDASTWMFIASSGISLFGYGELVRVAVHQTEEGAVAVRVFTLRKRATNITANEDWSGPIFEPLDSILQQRAAQPSTSPDIRALTLRSFRAGRSVRIAGPTIGTVQGSIVGFRDGALWLQTSPPQGIPGTAIDSVWVSQPHTRAGAVVGMLISTAVALAVASRRTCDFQELAACQMNALAQTSGILIGGTLLGAAVGKSVKSWKLRYP